MGKKLWKRRKIPTNIVFYNRLIGNLKDNEMIIRYYSIDSTWRTAFVAWMVNYFDSIIVPDHYRIEPKMKNYSTKDIIQKLNSTYILNTDLPPVTITNSQPRNTPSPSVNVEGIHGVIHFLFAGFVLMLFLESVVLLLRDGELALMDVVINTGAWI